MRCPIPTLAMLIVACNGGQNHCTAGTVGCECTPGGLCDPPGTCVSGWCVPPAADTGTDADAPADFVADSAGDAVEVECTTDGDCDDSDPCTEDRCDTDDQMCVNDPVDADDDGYVAIEVDGHACAGTDCDDGDFTNHPGADNDSDGYADSRCGGDDCDDTDGTNHPGADNDSDGYADPRCGGDDCDDTDGTIHPGATGVCDDGLDQDCDGEADDLSAAMEALVFEADARMDLAYPLVWTGSGFGVGWMRETAFKDLVVDSIGADGVGLDSPATVVTGTSSDDLYGEYMLVWTGSEMAVFYRMDSSGSLRWYMIRTDPEGSPVAGAVEILADPGAMIWSPPAFSGSELGVAWSGNVSSTVSDLYLMRLSPTGAILEPGLLLTDSDASVHTTTVTWTGSEYGLAWMESVAGIERLLFSRMAGDGAALMSDLDAAPGADRTCSPQVLWAGSEYGLTWDTCGAPPEEVLLTRIGPEGDLRSESTVGVGQMASTIWMGTRYVVAYQSFSGGSVRIFATELDGTGSTLVAPRPIVEMGDCCGMIALAGSGSAMGLVWTTGGQNPYFALLGSCDEVDVTPGY